MQSSPVIELPWTPRRFRAPREDMGVLCQPSLPAALQTARQNHADLSTLGKNLQGRTVAQLRDWSRREILQAAREYTALLLAAVGGPGLHGGELDPLANRTGLLFVSGHQPSLFHPGVWVKNFAVCELARRSSGTALNFLVDTDLMGSSRIRVPAGGPAALVIERVPFDEDRPRAPWEENAILDRALFESFGQRVCAMLAPWHATPLACELWPAAVSASRSFPLLRDCLVAARCVIEHRWGAGNLELPISRICELDPFLWFAGHILAHLPRFCAVHNEALAEFRRVNHVRSRTHPVPELKSDDGWTEAPFWVWRRGDTVRGRVFAMAAGNEVVLSDGREEFARLPLGVDRDACCAVEVLRELPGRGIRLRPRALATTLFARLCLADLFVHGIGGAKYDEMTDRILARFFGVTPPEFLTMTATLYPGFCQPHSSTRDAEARQLRLLRDLRWNADRHLDIGKHPEAAPWIAEKQSLLTAMQTPGAPCCCRRDRHTLAATILPRFLRMHELNQKLADIAADQRHRVEDELAAVRRQLNAEALLCDREFSFCIDPPDKLQRLMDSLWSKQT